MTYMILEWRETVIVYSLASGWKTMPLTITSVENDKLVILDGPKVAVSPISSGTVGGVQLVGLFQLLSTGFTFQVALPAKISWLLASSRTVTRTFIFVFMM